MKSCVLSPSADVTAQWAPSSGTEHFALVSDGSDGTEIHSNSAGAVEEWRLAGVPADFGTSVAVRVKVRARVAMAGFSRTANVTLTVGGVELGTQVLVVSGAAWADHLLTNAGWNAWKWDLDWTAADTTVRLTVADGAVRVYVAEVRVEVDYHKLALLRPSGDDGAQGWAAMPGPGHAAMVDEGTGGHDSGATIVRAQADGAADRYALEEPAADFGWSRRVEVRLVAQTLGDDEVTFQPVVGGVEQDAAAVGSVASSYGLRRASHGNWQNRSWSKSQIGEAALKMTYDQVGKSAYLVSVTAVELAVSYESGAVRGSVLQPALIEVAE